jgi:hypothetical protein
MNKQLNSKVIVNAAQKTVLQYYDSYPDDLKENMTKRQSLGEEPRIHPTCKIRDSYLGPWTDLHADCSLNEVVFDAYSYAAGSVSIVYADVGKFCSIASHTRINPGNHPMWRVTQHHMTYRRKSYSLDSVDDEEFFQWRRDHHCSIGHDVWIGHGAIIMAGVSVGTGAVIGSGSVVTKDIGPYEIAVGAPAKTIKKRFDDKTIEKLLASEWWNWDRQTLEERWEEFLDLDKFLANQ